MEETVYCGYSLKLKTRNPDFSSVPTAVFNFSIKWHHLLVFVDRLGVPISFQDTTLSELSQSFEMPLCILSWQSLCETHMERVLDALGVHHGFWAAIIRAILRTVFRASGNGHGGFDMNINLELATKDEVQMEDTEEASIGGYEPDPDQLKQKSYFVENGDGCCSICLEELDGENKVIKIPCSHSFHFRCIIKWLKSNNSCPLCHSKVQVEDPE
ncbi:hypothetical protein ACJRO7_015015 [Eucalyptus globulus]|uniref:RING-type domain-containing protein n=1 Tax=Eucalyptus globulus TaxID=34317 RepID=A0ABD3L327_EUCGL